jgi:hypothetical protein
MGLRRYRSYNTAAEYERIIRKERDEAIKENKALREEIKALKEEIKVFEAFKWGKND